MLITAIVSASRSFSCSLRTFALLSLLLTATTPAAFSAPALQVGVAAVDITPDYPVRLSGFGFRRTESEGITQRIYAKALAIADAEQGPAILITTDNLCVSDEIAAKVAERLQTKVGVKRERLTITATHTHTAPMLTRVAPTLFGTNIPPEHQVHIDQYTREFIDKLGQVAEAAMEDLKPAQLSWGVGEVKFATNRRTQGGPVDHDLSVLAVRNPDGSLRAIYFSYACHCVTLSNNKISGDWAGFAQDAVQKHFPGAIALASVGCGADSNPKSGVTGDKDAAAAGQGQDLADEVKRVLSGEMKPITELPKIRYDRLDLPLDTARSREQWEERSRSRDYALAHHARLNLSRLDQGETLPTKLNYPIQTWLFGEQLAMVFLPGETVVDYSLRLKREFDRTRLWVNAYSNDGRCYIPSERVLKEGGYEGGDAMIYYDVPQRFAPGVEQRIFDVIAKQLPKSFVSSNRTEGIRPLSPTEALRAFHTRPGLEIELVASEPLIQDPVAIDWAADGRLWVCEMNDYPAGLDGNWLPGGRIKILEDTDGDGRYDKATLFAENIPFPTGIAAWGRGVFICAAPDILYAEDTNGDAKADRIEKVFSGFATDNYQARVNSLQLGLDNWIYGANGLLGGTITSHPDKFPRLDKTSAVLSGRDVNIRNHDFRISPFTAQFETVTGISQQGRARDDWDNWFGCDNSQLLLHFDIPEYYLRRNPHIPAPTTVRNLTARRDGNRLYPRSRLLERFNDLDQANRTTSACGLAIYRDTLLGDEFYGNAFTCEVVHNLVHREIVMNDDGAISSSRATDERDSEFLTSTDNWFRPAQVRTGPDGALYVVDMYRFLIEHPRWIPASRLAKIDVRAGSDMGRIYRLRPTAKKLRPVRDLSKLDVATLVAGLDTPNGTERDRVHVELLTRKSSAANADLERLALTASTPQVRVQALSALAGLGSANANALERALRDADAHLRAHALRLSEPILRSNPPQNLATAVLSLTNDSSQLVANQLALTLGEWKDKRAGEALAVLALKFRENPQFRACALTSAAQHGTELFQAFASLPQNARGRAPWIPALISTAAASEDPQLLSLALMLVAQSKGSAVEEFQGLAAIFQALDHKAMTLDQFIKENDSLRSSGSEFTRIINSARVVATDTNMPPNQREAALALFARKLDSQDDLDALCKLSIRAQPESVRNAAFTALKRQSDPSVAARLIELWPEIPLQLKSQVTTLLLSRPNWATRLLESVRDAKLQRNEISPADQQLALQSSNSDVRTAARDLFDIPARTGRDEIIAKYKNQGTAHGSPARGAELFAQNCASCHSVGSVGADVGPNLTALRDKDPEYWIKNILDPNAVVEPRFVAYDVELKDDRSLTGIIKSESGNGLTMVIGGGASESLLRSEIISLRAAKLSLMPEGLEAALPPDKMADLIAFLKQSPAVTSRGAPELVLRDPASVARLILDPSQPNSLRETTISSNPQFAADLIAEMTRDLVPGTDEEYVRIPWIWRVAIAAGKRNDPEQFRKILNVSLPAMNEPLRDWQAVVVGGGLINGVSQRGVWPQARFAEILSSNSSLSERWQRALDLSSAMTDDPKVKPGTRYDALRMLGCELWSKRGSQLVRYLSDKDAELQMGAVSGLADVDALEATQALAAALPNLTKENRTLAISALLRSAGRREALLAALESGKLSPRDLNENQVAQLKTDPDERFRSRATNLLTQ